MMGESLGRVCVEHHDRLLLVDIFNTPPLLEESEESARLTSRANLVIRLYYVMGFL